MTIKRIKHFSELIKGNIDLTKHPRFALVALEDLASFYGGPLYINSSYRTPQQNVKCGGSPTSSHLKGLAFDIKCTNSVDRYKLLDAIHIMGIKRYGIYKTFIHIDFDDTKPQEVCWFN